LSANGGAANAASGGSGSGGRISVAIGFTDADVAKLRARIDIPGLLIYSSEPNFTASTPMSVNKGSGGQYTTSPNGASNGTMQFVKILSASDYNVTILGVPAPLYGSPAPNGYGTWTISGGTMFTNTVISSPTTQSNGMYWSCLGWTAATNGGSISGTSTQAVFTVNTNVTLTWFWTNQYQLAVSAAPSGSVNSGTLNGFYTNGVSVTNITAAPDPGYDFLSWFGSDVPSGQANSNPLTVTMDRARTNITASFVSQGTHTKFWSGVNNWTSYSNWSPLGQPGTNDNVIITSGVATVSEAYRIGSLIVSNGATLVFANWSTYLAASNVTVMTGGVMTLPAAFTSSQMSNRIWVVCSNFTLDAGGSILAIGKGYARGPGGNLTYGYGPGGGYAYYNYGSGASHGGSCGQTVDGVGGYGANDVANAPMIPGSGGGGTQNGAYGGDGGGLVIIQASNGTVTINGTINANGNNNSTAAGGAGAGGGINIQCATFAGSSTGLLTAVGGNGDTGGGGGGGGRIAIVYQNVVRPMGIKLSVERGTGPDNNPGFPWAAQKGTIYFSDESLFNARIGDAGGVLKEIWGSVMIGSGWSTWTTNSLSITNAALSFTNFTLLFKSDLAIQNAGTLIMRGGTLGCTNDLNVNYGGALNIIGQPTNTTTLTNFGALVSVGGTLAIRTNASVYCYSDGYNGGSPLFQVGQLIIESNGWLDASGKGFAMGAGPGTGGTSGNYGSGGGHGGRGGACTNLYALGGVANDSNNVPLLPGSGGATGNYTGNNSLTCRGGGLVRIQATGLVTVNGIVNADGNTSSQTSGGGAGGGINIVCGTLGKSYGQLHAVGGVATLGSGGAGGGGRIAVWINVPPTKMAAYCAGLPNNDVITSPTNAAFLGFVSATNGLVGYLTNGPYASQTGTVLFFTFPSSHGTIFTIY